METNNMNIRERFEEIWPMPEGISWDGDEYMPDDLDNDVQTRICYEMDARLDTFTRCQETTDVYVSLVDELVRELENASPWIYDSSQYCFAEDVVSRAKQIMEQKK